MNELLSDQAPELLSNFAEFISVLRLSGIRTSTSEALDAIRALQYVDIADKSSVKAAFSACLAKSDEERNIFSKAFEAYFIVPEERHRFIESKRQAIEASKREIERQAEELKFQGEQLELAQELKEVYASLPEEEKQSIVEFLDRTSSGKNVRSEFKPVAEALVRKRLNAARREHEDGGIQYETIMSDAGLIAGEVLGSVRKEENLMHKRIDGISEEEVPAAVQIIRRLAGRLKKNVLRKYGASHRRRRPDIKNTIRKSMSTGGLLFRLKYKSRKKRKDKFLVLCDVSASMQRFSGFVLQFIHSMHSNTSETEAYIFSEAVEHLQFTGYADFESFSAQVRQSREWSRGTNIKTALSCLLDSSKSMLNSSLIVIVVSDAKTLEASAAAEKLKKLGKRVRKIVWLNPVPEREWGGIPAMEDFLKVSTMLDCSTLDKLASACSRLGI